MDGLAIGFADRNPFQGDLRFARLGEAERRGHRAEMRFANGVLDRLASLDPDHLAMHGHRPPLAVEAIVIGPCRIGLELEQVGLIGAQGRDAPGHLLREADENDRTARHADAPRIEGLSLHVELVEQRRIADRRLGIAHQDRRTGRGPLAAHDPGMAELRPGWAVTAAAAESVLAGVAADAFDPLARHIGPLDDRRSVVGRHAASDQPVRRGVRPDGPRRAPAVASARRGPAV